MKTKSLRIIKRLVFVSMFSFLTLLVSGQSQESDVSLKSGNQNTYGGFGYFMMGYHSFDLSELNNSFSASGYPELSTGSLSVGGGGHYLLKNWLIGGEGFGLPGSKVENDTYTVSSSGGYGFFDLGYLVWKTPSFFLYPVLGIGGGGMTVNMKEKDLQTTSFGDILNNSGRETNLENGGFMLNFSVLANYMILGEKEETYSGGFVLGIKAGYILSLDGNNWYQNNEKLNQTPDSGISGPYIAIVLGGGGLEIK